jgi:glucose-1-phosphate cytidylyltransferase
MKVVLLCGGLGMRLREETEFRPKPMIEVGGRPIVWHIMKAYAHHGFTEFVLCLGYRAEVVKRYFLEYEAMRSDFTVELGKPGALAFHGAHGERGWKVTLADTGASANTGARVKRVERHIDGDTFMLTYGDGVANVDVSALLAFHRAHGRIATVTGVRPPARFGELITAGDAVREFREKPQTSQGIINGGFFVLNRQVFSYLDDDDGCVLEREPLERLAKDGELMVYEHPGFWQCLDTPRDLQHLQEMWREGAPWNIWS